MRPSSSGPELILLPEGEKVPGEVAASKSGGLSGSNASNVSNLRSDEALENVIDKSDNGSDTAGKGKVIFVHVAGAVKKPGVYRLEEGQRVYEAIELAGPTDDADLDSLNLARLLYDEERIYVPKKGDAGNSLGLGTGSVGTDPSGYSTEGYPGFPININIATASQLESLPGIGPVLADRIIAYRKQNGRFQNKEELKNVSGIGDKTYSRIAKYIIVK